MLWREWRVFNIEVEGGTPIAGQYNYSWYNYSLSNTDSIAPAFAASQDLVNQPAGTYTVIVTDGNICTSSFEYVISEAEQITVELENINSNLDCFGDTDGNIDISVTGGIGNYTYLWSNGATTQDLENITVGTYTVTITDEANCSIQEIFNIGEPDEIVISFDDNVDSVTELLCYNDNNGSININVTGGTGEYTYLWQSGSIDASNFGAITQDISNLFAGEYILTVTDENGCQMPSETFIISQPDEINISLNQTESFVDLSCYNDSTGNLDIEVSGGFGQYTYLWSNGSTSDNLNNLPTGTYSVTITDENGCDMESENFEITQPS